MIRLITAICLAFALMLPEARAGVIATEHVETLTLKEKAEAQARLETLGVDAKEARARMDAMTDAEIRLILAADTYVVAAGWEGPGIADTVVIVVFLAILVVALL
jgi:hypothetical protein